MTLEIGIPYIWIDCLCIVQDDFEEWTLEAPKMGRIYNASVVTISATSSASGNDGLFNLKSSSMLPQPSDLGVAVKSTLSCGTESTLYLGSHDWINTSLSTWHTLLGDAPLLQRAWVAQERMCSRRIIHYTSTSMFWECKHCVASEDNALLTSDSFWVSEARTLFTDLHRSTFEFSNDEVLGIWYARLVETIYSRCKLTFGRDKLVAIAGLAKLIHDKTDMPYYAGHWGYDSPWFIESLCWSRESPGSKTREYRAPSWSWASLDAAIGFYGAFRDPSTKYLSTVLKVSVTPQPPATNYFGLLSGGEMTIEGPLLACKLKYIPWTRREDSGMDLTREDAEWHILDDDTPPSDSVIFHALALRSVDDNVRLVNFLLLSPAGLTFDGAMKRIGFGLIHTGHDWAQELLQAPVTAIVVV